MECFICYFSPFCFKVIENLFLSQLLPLGLRENCIQAYLFQIHFPFLFSLGVVRARSLVDPVTENATEAGKLHKQYAVPLL